MKKIKALFTYFTKGELILWLFSLSVILISFLCFDRENYLTFRRSPFFAFVYAMNDIVLIILWILATAKDISYLSVIICFAIFLINDLYGFFNWRKMEKVQKNNK